MRVVKSVGIVLCVLVFVWIGSAVLKWRQHNLPNGYYISRDDEGSAFLANSSGSYIAVNRAIEMWEVQGEMVDGRFKDGSEFQFNTRTGQLVDSDGNAIEIDNWKISENPQQAGGR